MAYFGGAGLATGMAGDALEGIAIGAITLGVVVAGAIAAGFTLIARRGRGRGIARAGGARAGRVSPRTVAGPSGSPAGLADDAGMRANIALVHLDDEVARATEELGYATAQFGEAAAAGLASALADARQSLTGAFALKQRLDDSIPNTGAQTREWTATILSRCSAASRRLAEELARLDEMRGQERSARDDLAAVRERLAAAEARLPGAVDTVAALAGRFARAAIAPVAGTPNEVRRLLDDAARRIAEADALLASGGTGAVATPVRAAERATRRAHQLLDDVAGHAVAMDAASSTRLSTVIEAARTMARDARIVRDSPPDPATGAAVGTAITAVERAVAAESASDPDAAMGRIDAATTALDAALAGARNQRQRLEHATEALQGALLSARSQIATTTAYIGGSRGSTGADARTRLAEAERLLAIAEAEADPLLALDTARSAATYARDADALARYDLMR